MKKYITTIVSSAVILSSLMTGIAAAENNENNNVSASGNLSVRPITVDVLERDLRQELNIKEGYSRNICKEANTPCPMMAVMPQTEVLIKAAKVTKVDTNMLTVSIFSYSYLIDTSSAKLVRQYWGASSIDEVSIGDIVNVAGNLDASNNMLVHAQTVRNVSIQARHGVFKGTVGSIDATTTSFVLVSDERGKQTVKVSADTKIIVPSTPIVCVAAPCVQPAEKVGVFADIQVGQKIVLRGIWDKTLSTVKATVILIGGETNPRPYLKGKVEVKKVEKIDKSIDQIEKKIDKTQENSKKQLDELNRKLKELLEMSAKLKASATVGATTTQ